MRHQLSKLPAVQPRSTSSTLRQDSSASGMTTDALTVAGGIALMFVAIPMMVGSAKESEPVPEASAALEAEASSGEPAAPELARSAGKAPSWQSVLFVPVFFPITMGGTPFAFFVAARAEAKTLLDVVALSVAGLAFAAVAGVKLYASAHVERRASPGTRTF